MADAQDLQRLQQIAEAQMAEKMQDSTSGSDEDSYIADDLQQEVDMLATDPQGKAEILSSKTRGKVIDFKRAEQLMNDEIKLFNSKHNIDAMEVEDDEDDYIEPEE